MVAFHDCPGVLALPQGVLHFRGRELLFGEAIFDKFPPGPCGFNNELDFVLKTEQTMQLPETGITRGRVVSGIGEGGKQGGGLPEFSRRVWQFDPCAPLIIQPTVQGVS